MNEFTFVFTVSDLNVIVSALNNAPYAQAAPVIRKLEEQTQKQIADAQASEG